ncbi:redox-sensing transcriptional repressor Rex [Ornithinimicrobium sp. CNJ-824]|uniref:redox-sensing transcriptional repressor Rex n=1 Tax=Ornithinimicrobium sp. CNJ-824 TaxID=1904966 RepID=UPI000967F579|nr:redox-sensing transcriptional repressor Rex [Ornithinimicrobium sp. CNJ-824]OLT22998.1 redox-sensing transcriptional repressor Rex [Ornithinimicrobium sp. CNJ-824]
MTAEPTRRGVPEATVGRLPGYLRALTSLGDEGRASVSSEELADLSGVRSAQVRKDLSSLGSYGVRGVGYDVPRLSDQIAAELGLSRTRPVVIVGMGNLGRALASYGGLTTRGFQVTALVDTDPAVVGRRIDGLTVTTMDRLTPGSTRAGVGVITTPAGAAQEVADALVEGGVRSILNFAPAVLRVPPTVHVRAVDLAAELAILAFHEHQQALSTADGEDVG